MATDEDIEFVIANAVFNAHNTHGHLAPGDRLFHSLEDTKIIAVAVLEALKKGGHLKQG